MPGEAPVGAFSGLCELYTSAPRLTTADHVSGRGVGSDSLSPSAGPDPLYLGI